MSQTGSVLDLLERGREAIGTAYAADHTAARHLASVRAVRLAAAALAVGRGGGRGPGPHDLWALTTRLAPDLAEWAEFLALASARAEQVAAGGGGRVGVREADDLLRSAETFVDLVAARLGLPVRHDPGARLVPTRSA